MAVVAYLEEHVIPCLIGRDAHQIEDIWQYLCKGDGSLKEKLLDCLFSNYLGKSRRAVTVFAHVNGKTIDEVLSNSEVAINQGYKVVRLQCTLPGVEGAYG